MMNIKKTALASAIALAFVSSQSWAARCDGTDDTCSNTSTVSGQFILDKTTVTAGGKVNLAVLGLNASGEVDRDAEEFGSTIFAMVRTEKGNISVGGTSGASPTAGAFATEVKYVTVGQGNGRIYIEYPVTAEGTDTIEVSIHERYDNQQGGVTTRKIASTTKTVTIKPVTPKIAMLDITGYEKPVADVKGGSDTDVTGGIDGKMTAGIGGGQITVIAKNAAGDIEKPAKGMLTLTLANSSKSYEYTGTMSEGQAIVTLPSDVTVAGTYLMKATLEGFDGSSVDLYNNDTLMVETTGTVKKLKLWSQKGVISIAKTGGNTGDPVNDSETMVKITMLDEYGNSISANPTTQAVKVSDANQSVGDGVVTFPAGQKEVYVKVGGNTTTDYNTLGKMAGARVGTIKVGTTSLTASIENQSTISPADPVAIKVVEKQLRGETYAGPGTSTLGIAESGGSPELTKYFDGPRNAGEEFKGFLVDVYTGAPGSQESASKSAATNMMVKRYVDGVKKEEVTLVLDQNHTILEAAFKKATGSLTMAANEYYIIGDTGGLYGEVLVRNQGNDTNGDIVPAAADKVELINGHKEIITASKFHPMLNQSKDKYKVMIPESRLMMVDGYGNAITSGNAGTATASSANASIVAEMDASGLPSNGKIVPGEQGSDAWVAYYNASGPDVFSGNDIVTLGSTKPLVGTNNLEVVVPQLPVLDKIVANIEKTDIPVNGTVALTIETVDQNGDLYNDPKSVSQGVNVNISKKAPATGQPEVQPRLVDNTTNVEIPSGGNLKFDIDQVGRKVIRVEAGANIGTFTLDFSNADGNITASKTFNVTREASPDECDANTLHACTTAEECSAAGGEFKDDVCVAISLPGLAGSTGKAAASQMDNQGDVTEITGVEFSGGISIDGGAYKQTAKNVSVKNNKVKIVGRLKVPAEHQGQKVDVLAVGLIKGNDPNVGWWMKAGNAVKRWDENPVNLEALEEVKALPAEYTYTMYEGNFVAPTVEGLDIYTGYRLGDGTVVFTMVTINVQIID